MVDIFKFEMFMYPKTRCKYIFPLFSSPPVKLKVLQTVDTILCRTRLSKSEVVFDLCKCLCVSISDESNPSKGNLISSFSCYTAHVSFMFVYSVK